MKKETVFVTGCKGYIGNALIQKLLKKNYKVIGVDNNSREKWVKELGSHSAIKQLGLFDWVKQIEKLGEFKFFNCDVSKDVAVLKEIIIKEQPSTIVHLAHQPSAPHSMINRFYGEYSLQNNIMGTNNLLWLIKEINPKIHFTTIGSTGEYCHNSNIKIEEGYFDIEYNGRQSEEMIYPRQANSIYHTSKIASFYLTEYLTRIWNLKTTEAEQSVVFGLYTNETNESGIHSRLDIDSCFGTVLNKFIVQAILDVPLTIFGKGEHKRGFIALNDSINAIMLSIENPPESGKLRCFNQLTETHSINKLASMVYHTAKKFNKNVNFNYFDSPRKEFTDSHYYEYALKKLPELGYKATRTIEQEIEYVFSVINQYYISDLKSPIVTNIQF